MLRQIDASRHDGLEGRGPWLSLVGGIDDATGLVPWASLRDHKDALGYSQLLRDAVRRRGIPMAVYRRSAFTPIASRLSCNHSSRVLIGCTGGVAEHAEQ
jgi:hypothetical protein